MRLPAGDARGTRVQQRDPEGTLAKNEQSPMGLWHSLRVGVSGAPPMRLEAVQELDHHPAWRRVAHDQET